MEQMSDEQAENINNSFEYKKELNLVETNLIKLQERLLGFTQNMAQGNRVTIFNDCLNDFNKNNSLNGLSLNKALIPSSQIPGFIKLEGNKQIDVLHGVIYVGDNKLGLIPSHIQCHVSLKELGMTHLPFKPHPGGYAYSEKDEIKAFIAQETNGTLLIQKELNTLSNHKIMLQYVSPALLNSIPPALKNRMDIEHFFMDASGGIHGFSSDFHPILEISPTDKQWQGYAMDHNDHRISISLGHETSSAIMSNLVRLFPQNEMLRVNDNTVYIPSIKQYISSDEKSGNYFITDDITSASFKRHLRLTQKDAGHTEKVLSVSEANEIKTLKNKASELKNELSLVQGTGIINHQQKSKIMLELNLIDSKIHNILSSEFLTFAPNSPLIESYTDNVLRLKDLMETLYNETITGSKGNTQLLNKHEESKANYLRAKETLRQAYKQEKNVLSYQAGPNNKLIANDFKSIIHVGQLGRINMLNKLLDDYDLAKPLTLSELNTLTTLKKTFKEKKDTPVGEQLSIVLLMGIELQHHILTRHSCAVGKKENWDKDAFQSALREFEITLTNNDYMSQKTLITHLEPMWEKVKSEYDETNELHHFFKKIEPLNLALVNTPILLNEAIHQMPIQSIATQIKISFKPHENIASLIDDDQQLLENRLNDFESKGLSKYKDLINQQEDGYYYENYGLFNKETIEKLFKISTQLPGVAGLTSSDASKLFHLMENEGWIKSTLINGKNRYQITKHPSEFYSSFKVTSLLTELGMHHNSINIISERLEVFLHQTATNSGTYSLQASERSTLINDIVSQQERCNIETLQANDKIQSILSKASTEVTFTDLQSAYLTNDYLSLLSSFPQKEHEKIRSELNNSLTRMLYYKTELDHLSDVKSNFDFKNDAKAMALLHIRRNYSLDALLTTKAPNDPALTDTNIKMQKAFLLFESDFKHRCNARQVDIFRGLLLDDETDPDKIDSAQATMGFGKTSLLPLIALFKTGDKLVRFIVPKSALETNSSDISLALKNIIGSRAVKDDFFRYRITSDPEQNMGESSPKLHSLRDAKADLKKRLCLYKHIQKNKQILVQAPNVRNSIECQAQIFLDMIMQAQNEPLHELEIMSCISLINEIRSLTTVSIYDELDATQNLSITDVNYTSGEKISFEANEVLPLETICQIIHANKEKSHKELAELLLKEFNFIDNDQLIEYVTSLEEKKPDLYSDRQMTPIYLIRAILTDPNLLKLFTEKDPNTDYGVWFENAVDGSKKYDYSAIKTQQSQDEPQPLLITVPYLAANTPKPQGSRFDNAEVTAITTFLYYQDERSEINEKQHLDFIINSFRNGVGEMPFLDSNDKMPSEFLFLFESIKQLSNIEDATIRNKEKQRFFNEHLNSDSTTSKDLQTTFRKVLSRYIIHQQIKSDSGKANSNRYEQGTINDSVIGFSGTAGDTSSHFDTNRLDPAADGNMTLGIMGRTACQATSILDTTSITGSPKDYTTSLIEQLSTSFTKQTRVIIDAGGLCKTSNRDVAKAIAIKLSALDGFEHNKGVIFYDDISNTRKVLIINESKYETIIDLTDEMVKESDHDGNYFTYYDQAHSRGADIKQMDSAHALLTLSFSVTNNDYKQAIMRMRKIVSKQPNGQSFSVAVPTDLKNKIFHDLQLNSSHKLTGNDIAFWLRINELTSDSSNVSLIMMEVKSIIKNAILQQQAQVTQLLSGSEISAEQISTFRDCIQKLNDISPMISMNESDLEKKYGLTHGEINKDNFLTDLHKDFNQDLLNIFDIINQTREKLLLETLNETARLPYEKMERKTLSKRAHLLDETIKIPFVSSSVSDAQSENQSESQSESQSNSQAQAHSFSEVNNEEVAVNAILKKQALPNSSVTIDYLYPPNTFENLTLASHSSHLNHIFNDSAPIRCSTSYIDANKENSLSITPPVRYFFAREEGTPSIILANQDEADLFKQSPIPPWALFDLKQLNDSSILPIVSSSEFLLNPTLLKKLSFASFNHQTNGSGLVEISHSLSGIFPASHLVPSLDVSFNQALTDSSDHTVPFTLDKWGFSGTRQQEIPLSLSQTNQIKNDKFYKTGVTLSIGQGEDEKSVFISSKLNERILTKSKQTLEQTGSNKFVEAMEEDITHDYKQALEERTKLRKSLDKLKESKAQTIEEYDKTIQKLETKKTNALNHAKTQINDNFEPELKEMFNIRKKITREIDQQLEYACYDDSQSRKGIRTYGQGFNNLDEAIAFCCKKYLEEGANDDELLANFIEKSIKLLSANAYTQYSATSGIETIDETFIEFLYSEALKNPSSKIMINDKSLYAFLYNYMKPTFYWLTDEQRLELFKCFTKAIDSLRSEPSKRNEVLLYREIEKNLSEFKTNNEGKLDYSIDTDFVEQTMQQITFSLNPSMTTPKLVNKTNAENKTSDFLVMKAAKKERADLLKSRMGHRAALKRTISTCVKHRFLKHLQTVTLEEKEGYHRIGQIITSSMDNFDYALSKKIMVTPSSQINSEEIKPLIADTLKIQNVRASSPGINRITTKYVNFLKGKQAIDTILKTYIPIENRASTITTLDDKDVSLPQSTHEILIELDKQTLDIQNSLNDAKAQKIAELADIQSKQTALKSKLQESTLCVAALKTEKSALSKLVKGMINIMDVFHNYFVAIDKKSRFSLLEDNLDLPSIISNQSEISATLTFSPPEIYTANDDMVNQEEQKHGLTQEESLAKTSLKQAISRIKEDASLIKDRPCLTNGKKPQLKEYNETAKKPHTANRHTIFSSSPDSEKNDFPTPKEKLESTLLLPLESPGKNDDDSSSPTSIDDPSILG